jgi:hypothetical protein
VIHLKNLQSRAHSQLQAQFNLDVDFDAYWDAANGTGALADLKFAYPGQSFAGPFDQFTVDFFNSNQNWDCALVQNDCGAGLACDEADTPGGYVILQSYAGLHNVRPPSESIPSQMIV